MSAVAAPAETLMIGGERIAAADGTRSEVTDPSTGRAIAEVPRGKAVDVDRAVAAARAAWDGWRRIAPADRGRMILHVATRLGESVRRTGRPRTVDPAARGPRAASVHRPDHGPVAVGGLRAQG